MKTYTKAVCVVALFLLSGSPVWAGNKLINVQGKLTNAQGAALAGPVVVTFRLYKNLGDGVASAVWIENQNLTPQSGLFNATLGNVSSLNLINFNQPYYLGVQVAGDPNEMQPRQVLGASAYALGSLGDFNVGQNLIVGSSVTVTKGIVGVQDGSSAAPGMVGEYIQSLQPLMTSPPVGTWGNLTSITLTPGDWDMSMGLTAYANGGTVSVMAGGVGSDPGGSAAGLVDGLNDFTAYVNFSGGGQQTETVPPYRISLTTTTTFYAKVFLGYTGAAQIYGRLSARRVR